MTAVKFTSEACSAFYSHVYGLSGFDLRLDVHSGHQRDDYSAVTAGVNCSVCSSHLILFVFERDLEVLRGTDHGLHGGEDVLVDEFGEATLVLVGVARPVNDAHLFDERTLAALARA